MRDFHLVTLAPNLPGPVAAKRFADLGARVTKIEGPGKATDPMRAMSPDYYRYLTAGQEVRQIDLKAGLEELFELLGSADLLLTSSRPASLERLGLGWDALHERFPALVQVAIVGHGGEHSNQAGHDLTYEAEAGTIAFGADGAPVMPVLPLADMAGAERAVSEGFRGLWQASLTGEGSYHEVGLADMAGEFATVVQQGLSGPGTLLGGALPQYNLYEAADGEWVAVAALEPHFMQACAAVMDFGSGESGRVQPDIAAGPTYGLTHDHYRHAIALKPSAEWARVAQEHNLPIAVVRRGR